MNEWMNAYLRQGTKIPVVSKQRPEDQEFKVIFAYVANLRSAWDI